MPDGISKHFHVWKTNVLPKCPTEINFLDDVMFSKWIRLKEEIPGNERLISELIGPAQKVVVWLSNLFIPASNFSIQFVNRKQLRQ